MQAGRELDELIATKVMGWRKEIVYPPTELMPPYYIWVNPMDSDNCLPKFNPSTNIADAWEVVEKMLEQGYDMRLDYLYAHETYICLFDKAIPYYSEGGEYANTAPLAICLAALKTVGVKVNA